MVMTHVAEEAHLICVVTATLGTGPRITDLMSFRSSLLFGKIKSRIIYAKIEDATRILLTQVGCGRIIGIKHEYATGGKIGHRLLPVCRDIIHLAIAVKLVSEK